MDLPDEIRNIDITSICFDLIVIKDDVEYHKALYGDFIVIMMKTSDYRDGYVNATKLCKDGGKRFDNWIRLDKSKELMNELDRIGSSDVRRQKEVSTFLVNGGNNDIGRLISGTYIHPDLIAHLALWISTTYALKVSKIINKYTIDYYLKEIKDKKDKLEEKIKEYEITVESKNNAIKRLEESNKNLEDSITELNQTNTTLNNTLTGVRPRIVHRPRSVGKYITFSLLRIDNSMRNYYIFKVQERDYIKRITSLRNKYPDCIEILRLDRIPNGNYLFDRIKNDLSPYIEVNINNITLTHETEFTETDLILRIQEISESNITPTSTSDEE